MYKHIQEDFCPEGAADIYFGQSPSHPSADRGIYIFDLQHPLLHAAAGTQLPHFLTASQKNT